MKRFVTKINRVLIGLIDQLQMARQRGEPAYIDRVNQCLAVPDDYDPFARYRIGETFGKHGERITKLVRGRRMDAAPFWFAPKKNANHIALVSPYNSVLYMEVEHRPVTLFAQHPFDITVATRAEQGPRVVSLFEDPPAEIAVATTIEQEQGDMSPFDVLTP
jgi:hypothetical protein